MIDILHSTACVIALYKIIEAALLGCFSLESNSMSDHSSISVSIMDQNPIKSLRSIIHSTFPTTITTLITNFTTFATTFTTNLTFILF